VTADEFIATLSPALSLRGADSVRIDDVVKTIRADIKRALAVGALPPGTKVSVRKEYSTYTAHLYVQITEWVGAIFTDNYLAHLLDPTGTPWDTERRWNRYRPERDDERLTPPLNDALRLLEHLANRHNFDESDSMVDYFHVGYYLDVDAKPAERVARDGVEQERDPQYAELCRRAHVAAAAVGDKVVRSVCGRHGLSGAGKWALEQLIKVADRANGRPLTYDKRRRAWLVSS
jgi:hypothetical protein